MPRTRNSQAQAHLNLQLPQVQPIYPMSFSMEGLQQPSPVSSGQQSPNDCTWATSPGQLLDFDCPQQSSQFDYSEEPLLLQDQHQKPFYVYNGELALAGLSQEFQDPFLAQYQTQPDPQPQAELGFQPDIPLQPELQIQPETQPERQPQLQQTSPASSNLNIGDITLDLASLHLPQSLPDHERHNRLRQIQQLVADHDNNLPILPESQIEDPPMLEAEDGYQYASEATSDEHRRQIEESNNTIAGRNENVQRKRNNQSAKKTRMKREEKLCFARQMICELTIELTLLRVRLNASGCSTDTADLLPEEVRYEMAAEMSRRTTKAEKARDLALLRRQNKEKMRLRKEAEKRQKEAERLAAGLF